MDEFRDENTLLDDEVGHQVKLKGKLKFGPLTLGGGNGGNVSNTPILTETASSISGPDASIAVVGSHPQLKNSTNGANDFMKSRGSITSSNSTHSLPTQSSTNEKTSQEPRLDKVVSDSKSQSHGSKLFPLIKLKNPLSTPGSENYNNLKASAEDSERLSTDGNSLSEIILDSKQLQVDEPGTPTPTNQPAEDGYKRLISEISFTGSEDFSDSDKVHIVKPTGLCWVCHHQTIRRNWKVFLAAVILTFGGLALIISGIAIGSVVGFTSDLKSVVFLVGGILCFIPGGYHFVFLILAAYGVKGFKFSKLPTIKMPE